MSSSKDIQGQYRGNRSELFPLAIGVALLTLVTFGIYRFWGKTRIRKYIWSSTIGDGDAFEYTGTGLEKFLGFLIAIVILAIYLGVVQMLLFFAGINYNFNPETPQGMIALNLIIYLNLLAVLPLMFYAAYRARRYKMARTRWRGVRFGMEKGAWGYAFRAIGYFFLSIVTLGILTPLATFNLEKYQADRSWYGDARFEQHGKWTALFGAMKHIWIGLAILIVGAGLGAGLDIPAVLFIGVFVGYIWLIVGSIYFRIHAFRYMAANRTLDGTITFTALPSTGEVIKIYIIGMLLISLAAVAIGIVAFALIAAVGSMFGSLGMMGPVVALALVIYVGALVMIGALGLIFITQPTIAHFITTMTVHNADALNDIQQRATESGIDAEGFADALDIGGAI